MLLYNNDSFLKLSKTELELLFLLSLGKTKMFEIVEDINISQSQLYRIVNDLKNKGIISSYHKSIVLESKTHVGMLLRLISKTKYLIDPLSGTGLMLFSNITTPKTLREIIRETALHKTTIFKKITQARKMSLLIKEKQTYRINEKVWPDAKEFFIELRNYEQSIDSRIPLESEIYFKNSSEIVFSNKNSIDASITAFSAYESFGIKLLLLKYYYVLPKRKLSIMDVFLHSLYVAEKSKEIRDLIFVALFYMKYYRKFYGVRNPIIGNLNKIFKGEKIPNYPTLAEIKDRAKIYDIKIKK